MQSVLALLVLLLGSALAVPMTILTPAEDSQQNRAISATEYLKRIFEDSVTFSKPISPVSDQYTNIITSLTILGLDDAAEIVFKVREILQDKDLCEYCTFSSYLSKFEAFRVIEYEWWTCSATETIAYSAVISEI